MDLMRCKAPYLALYNAIYSATYMPRMPTCRRWFVPPPHLPSPRSSVFLALPSLSPLLPLPFSLRRPLHQLWMRWSVPLCMSPRLPPPSPPHLSSPPSSASLAVPSLTPSFPSLFSCTGPCIIYDANMQVLGSPAGSSASCSACRQACSSLPICSYFSYAGSAAVSFSNNICNGAQFGGKALGTTPRSHASGHITFTYAFIPI